MKNRCKISPLYGSKPYGQRLSLTEAESFAMSCAAHLSLEVRVHDRQTGSLRVYDPGQRRWFYRP